MQLLKLTEAATDEVFVAEAIGRGVFDAVAAALHVQHVHPGVGSRVLYDLRDLDVLAGGEAFVWHGELESVRCPQRIEQKTEP